MNKKYRLKKCYPGSPELGTVIYHFGTIEPFKYPEFWEEVVEKDYEIKTYTDGFNDYFKLDNGKWTINLQYEYKEEELLKKKLKIKSIKRLSDGEIFTLGDRIEDINQYKYDFDTSYFIKSIEIVKEGFLKFNLAGKGTWYGLNSCKKVKKPLFTTEDGVDIYEGDEIWGIELKNWKPFYQYAKCNPLNKAVTENWKHGKFSSKEKAEEYILWNKPVLSLREVASVYPGINKSHPDMPSHQAEVIKKMVKQKL